VDREQPSLSITSLRDNFAKADKATLSTFEFEALKEVLALALEAKAALAMAT
jgi:hypothetical protein